MPEPLIACRNVWKIFGPSAAQILRTHNGAPSPEGLKATGHIAAVRDVSLDVGVGEILVVMGLSESGKSTLIRCLARLIEPTSGEIVVEGKNLLTASRKELIELRRHTTGMAFQHFALLPHRTVLLLALRPVLPETLVLLPETVTLDFIGWLNVVIEALRRDEIFGWFTFRDITRSIAYSVEWPLDVVDGVLISGFDEVRLPPLHWLVDIAADLPRDIREDGVIAFLPEFDLPPVPWLTFAALVAGLGWAIGGWRLALAVSGFVLFIALTGYWERSMITTYMVFSALIVCVAIGLPLAMLAAHNNFATRAMEVVCDTFQTFQSFIYLIPVIMLFQVSDVAAITAIVIYAGIPVVRYTMFGLRNVPAQTLEAAKTSGCSGWQTLWHVRLPLALPEIMLGINQTIMFGLFMAIIASFIGTTDLGQEINRARADNDAGKGLVLGLCVAFIGLAADRLIVAWSAKRKKALGLD